MAFLDKMKRAEFVAADLEARAEKDADRLIARGAELDAKREKAFQAHHSRMDAAHDALDSFEYALNELGNGAPEDGAEPSPEPPRKPAGTPYDGTSPKTE